MDPIGPERLEFMVAQGLAMFVNAHRDPKRPGKDAKPADFMIDYSDKNPGRPRRMSGKEMAAKLTQFAQRANAIEAAKNG